MIFKKEKTRVNIKARLNRHLRIVKENIWINGNGGTRINWNHHYGFVLFFMFLIIPIYPTLASFVYNTSSYDYYRWEIDESSIIEAYYGGEDENWEQNSTIFETNDSFISVNSMLDDERDLAWTNEIVNYEVQSGDSFYSISYKFWVSTNSIYWANDFTKGYILKPWNIIKVPPVSWLIHQVQSWETLSSIAKKYNIEEVKIKEQNKLDNSWKLIAWEVLVLPWAIKIVPPKPVVKPVNIKTTTKKWYTNTQKSTTQYANGSSGKYNLVRRQPKHSFVWWNCTRYVAQYKNITWWWNANAWIKNARAAWKSTWSTPSIWAIVQLTGRWYNPRYGHVWIVMDITSTDIIISDMNYRRLNEVTYRKISINDRTIDWYIYID